MYKYVDWKIYSMDVKCIEKIKQNDVPFAVNIA